MGYLTDFDQQRTEILSHTPTKQLRKERKDGRFESLTWKGSRGKACLLTEEDSTCVTTFIQYFTFSHCSMCSREPYALVTTQTLF